MPLDMAFVRKVTGTGRKAALSTYLSAVFERKSIPQVRAERRAVKQARRDVVAPGAGDIIDQPRIRAQTRGGGWARVTYRDAYAGTEVTFNIRSNVLREALNQKQNRWYDPATAVYSAWIRGTRQGYLYSQRRQVEGMVKTARARGDEALAQRFEKVLGLSDEKVAQFREEWEKAHSDSEIEQFYMYDTTAGEIGVTVWE